MLPLENQTDGELKELKKTIDKELKRRNEISVLERLKHSSIIKKYSYIVSENDEDMIDMFGEDAVVFGWNAYNEPGFLDDHIPEEAQEDVHALLNILGVVECMSCTYDVDKDQWPRIEKILNDLGMKRMKSEW